MSNTVHPIFEPVIAAARGAAEQAFDAAQEKCAPAPWSLEDARQSTELTSILDAEGKRVAQWVPKHVQPLLLAAPDMLAALRFCWDALVRLNDIAAAKNDPDLGEELDDMQENIGAAIARATGREG